MDVCDPPDHAGVDELLEAPAAGIVAKLEIEQMHDASLESPFEHLLSLARRDAERLVTQNVVSVIKSQIHMLCVKERR